MICLYVFGFLLCTYISYFFSGRCLILLDNDRFSREAWRDILTTLFPFAPVLFLPFAIMATMNMLWFIVGSLYYRIICWEQLRTLLWGKEDV